MVTLPRQVEYALMALTDMHGAEPGEIFAVRGLCERHQIPFDVMSKTMQRLVRADILKSVKGVNGGYQLARDLSKISMLDLMEAVTGPQGVVMCLREHKACPLKGGCNVTRAMTAMDKKLKTLYRSTCVQELIEPAPVAIRS
ncbi:MAG: Rrf2 family transcriptional regulator [Verrucomicrobia bacterium]|nr:Rrf2 family transcriptional regulator [Verrucomicrobiota bacterium]